MRWNAVTCEDAGQDSGAGGPGSGYSPRTSAGSDETERSSSSWACSLAAREGPRNTHWTDASDRAEYQG